jgi:hypothetical protein
MARIVGIFENGDAVDAVVEQLQINNVTQLTVLRPDDDAQALSDQLRTMTVPDEQAAEYRTRLDNQRWLLFVQVSALELPTVQRALRSGQALDIDLLPEPGVQ